MAKKRMITEREVENIIAKHLGTPIFRARSEILMKDRSYPETFIYRRMVTKLKEELGVR